MGPDNTSTSNDGETRIYLQIKWFKFLLQIFHHVIDKIKEQEKNPTNIISLWFILLFWQTLHNTMGSMIRNNS